MAASPQTPMPNGPILDWDEAAVNTYFVSMGLQKYENVIYEHGITGEVLCALDMETLMDLGVTSLGHRLSVLRAVFELKKEQGVEIGEDDWRPSEEAALEAMETAAMMDRIWNLVLDHQERLQQVEGYQVQLIRSLQENGIQLPQPVPTLVEENGTPTTAMAHPYGPHSPGQFSVMNGGKLAPKAPPLTRAGSDGVIPQSSRGQRSGATNPLPTSPTPPVDLQTPTPAARAVSDRERDSSRDAAHSAAKSFRVTLEDPCWKVLPAALKKYKINDDWKMYALFICYGNTERCLSYDEKPLLLFQKLKESGQRPVFMLRHIRDIKSPIAVAQQKQAIKLGLPPNSTTNLLPTIETSNESPTKPEGSVAQPGTAQGDAPSNRTPGEGVFPELPSPGMREGSVNGSLSASSTVIADASGNGSAGSSSTLLPEASGSPNTSSLPKTANIAPGTLVDKDGNVHKVTYATSIYPYIADRRDEFDVAVGASFVVMSKAKGWWFVQKDPQGAGQILSDPAKSAWVPAGCLLELTTPIASISPLSPGKIPGLASVPPTNIMSSSYPGVVLMDYTSKDTFELGIKEGEKVRVYKKYCHWSYCIKESTGERGWVPAWFVGKISANEAKAAKAAREKEKEKGMERVKDKADGDEASGRPGASPVVGSEAGAAGTAAASASPERDVSSTDEKKDKRDDKKDDKL